MDIIQAIADNWQSIASAAAGVVAVIGAISAQINKNKAKRLHDETDQLIKEKLKGHYIKCPVCHNEINLDEQVQYFLPGGFLDNDLDGKAD